MADSDSSRIPNELAARAIQTLDLMHKWGYAPSVESLATHLLGGSVVVSQILTLVRYSSTMSVRDGFVYLNGNERLVEESKRRVTSHRLQNGEAFFVANEFAHDLIRSCPVVDCVALSGSAASGGYAHGDDVDFDLFVRDGTKYFVYGVALALGLKAALRRWRSRGFRKLICINVIWNDSETKPFTRQDEGLAFELLRCHPLIGAGMFRDVIGANRWAIRYFPQLRQKVYADGDRPQPSMVGRAVLAISRHPRLLKVVELTSRLVTRAVYETAHLLKNGDPQAMTRIKFLLQVKYPYEFFQD